MTPSRNVLSTPRVSSYITTGGIPSSATHTYTYTYSGKRAREKREERSGEKGRTGRDTLNAAAAGETADGGLGDALDVVAEDLAVAFGAAFAEAFAAFSACGVWWC